MSNESQTSYDKDIDASLNLARAGSEPPQDAQVFQFSERQVSVDEEPSVPEVPRKRRNRLKGLLATTATVAVTLFLTHTAGGEPAPNEIRSYTELAKDQAKIPAQPGEKPLIDEIKLDANDPDRNSGSEAVLNNEEVKEFMDEHPDQRAAIISSANGLPTAHEGDEYALVERNINPDVDKDPDVVAVPVEQNDK